jgi:hypothetical protein
VEAGRTPDHPVRVPASRRQLDELARCLLARRPVLLALLAAGSDPADPSVKRAAYRRAAAATPALLPAGTTCGVTPAGCRQPGRRRSRGARARTLVQRWLPAAAALQLSSPLCLTLLAPCIRAVFSSIQLPLDPPSHGHAVAPACRYLRDHGKQCRQPMPVPPDIDPADRLARSTTFHTGLMHTCAAARRRRRHDHAPKAAQPPS